MRILVSGGSGLIGSNLIPLLESRGHEVLRLVRKRTSNSREVLWNISSKTIEVEKLAGLDAVIHLAGESIVSGLWTKARKESIRDSRVIGTRVLCEALKNSGKAPAVFIGASAIGYYGDRGSEICDESSAPGSGFLAELAREWEAASATLTSGQTRIVHCRLGIVLSKNGGALSKMLLPFKLGLGGRLGSGSQYMSWIALADLMRIFLKVLEDKNDSGPINCVAPNACTNSEFTKTLAKVLKRPAIFHVPAFLLRAVAGQLADEALLSSTRVLPKKLLASGYKFEFQELQAALERELA